jgi:cytochrome c-type biogenesis protein CcmH
MTVFILIAVLLVAFALAWVLPPLLRRRAPRTDVERASLNVRLLREQLAELEADLASGTLSAGKYTQAKEELERRVIEDTVVADEPVAVKAGGGWSALALVIVVPLAAALLYFQLGNPEALLLSGSGSGTGSGREHQVTPQQLESMAAKLAAKLEQNPGDPAGWALLARSYYQLRRIPEAIAAYEKAAALTSDDAALYADYADALAMVQGRSLEGKPLELIKRALAIDPTQWKALALAGTAAFDRKDYREAVRYWEQLRVTLPPESEMAQSITASITDARNLGGIKDAPAPKVADVAPAAKAPVTAKSAGSVEGTVTLSPAVAGKTSPSDRVFVFARAAQGSKMPLAIVTIQVKDLPFKFKLDDAMAMQAGMSLSNFPEVVVGARVAKSGNANAASGDLEGLSKPVKVGASGLSIVIDTVLP